MSGVELVLDREPVWIGPACRHAL